MRDGTVLPNGEEIKRLRTERGWTQDDLAHESHLSKGTIENAEAGRPVVIRTLSILATTFGSEVSVPDLLDSRAIDAFAIGDDAATETSDLAIQAKRIGNAPALPSLLIGRERDLAKLTARLARGVSAKQQPATQVLTAVRGWPGVGKTTVARAMAHWPEVAAAFPDGVLWAALGPSPQILSELLAWGRSLGEESILLSKDIAEASQRITGLLRDRRMLLIVDDAWDASHVVPFAVGGRQCAMLVTTRLTSVADALAPTPGDIYHLNVLSENDSLKLLSTLAPQVVKSHQQECRELVAELEGLPLALQVAGRLLRAEHAKGWSVPELLRELRDDKAKLLNAQAPADMAASPGEVSPTVAALLRKSTDSLDPTVRKRFASLAPFAPRPATFELEDIMAVWKSDEASTRQTIDVLVDRGLLEPVGDGDFQIHQVLVHHADMLLKLLKKR